MLFSTSTYWPSTQCIMDPKGDFEINSSIHLTPIFVM